MDKNKQEKNVSLAQKDSKEKEIKNIETENIEKKEREDLETKHLKVLHLLFELDFYGLNNPVMDDFFDPNSLEMLDDKIEVLNDLKNGKKEAEIPKFYDVLEYLNDCDTCSRYEEDSCDIDEESLSEYLETESEGEIERYFRKAMQTFKKDIKELKKEKAKKKDEKKNKKKKKNKLKSKDGKKSKKIKLDKKAKKKNKIKKSKKTKK